MRFFILFFLFIPYLNASTLQLTLASNPSRLNPLLATDSASAEIAGFLFNALVKYDKDSTTVIGDLAKKFYFKNKTTLLFKLRKNVTWQDGAPFTAQDVLFTYHLLRSKKIVTPYSSDFRVVKSVKALDRYTVEVTYKRPYFKALEIWMMGIVPKHILENVSNIMDARFNTHPVGTGPYILQQMSFSKAIVLVANKHYFLGKPKIDKIVFHIIPDAMTRFLMLKSGKVDVDSLSALQYERQLNKNFFTNYRLYENISYSYTYLGFNLRKKKFQDPRVREALSLAINRKALVKVLFLGHARVCTGPFFPKGPAFNATVKAPKQNIKKAMQLLREVGYDKTHPLRFEITTSNTDSIRPYAAQILQYQLKKVGVIATIRVMEWQAFLNMVVFPRKFDTVLLAWSLGSTPDPYLI
jgi:peptide/nickel transport system substrate-binding protein